VLRNHARDHERRVCGERRRDHGRAEPPPGELAARDEVGFDGLARTARNQHAGRQGEGQVAEDDRPVEDSELPHLSAFGFAPLRTAGAHSAASAPTTCRAVLTRSTSRKKTSAQRWTSWYSTRSRSRRIRAARSPTGIASAASSARSMSSGLYGFVSTTPSSSAAAPANSDRMTTPSPAALVATYSFATRLSPSRSGVTHSTSAAA